MREGPLNHKYTKVEDRADLMDKEVTKPRSDSGNRGHIANDNSRQNYRGNRFRGNSRGYVRENK